MFANAGHEIGNISAVAFSFMVHEPSGIIEVVSERSRDSSFFRYRSISVSVWWVLKTGWLRNSEVRRSTGVSPVWPTGILPVESSGETRDVPTAETAVLRSARSRT